MNVNNKISIFTPFIILSSLTLFVYIKLWMIKGYWIVLSVLFILSVFSAVQVIAKEGVKPLPITGVILGLLLGQWWLLEFIVMQVFFNAKGFGP